MAKSRKSNTDYHMQPFFQTPKQLAQPSLTVRQLAQVTPFDDRFNSKTVQLENVKDMPPPGGLPADYKVARGRTVTDENGHQYSPRVFYTDATLSPESKVICDCQCGRWVFTYETANAHKGAAFLYRSNGEPPSTRNPRQRVGLCKHVYRLCAYLVKQGKKPVAQRTKIMVPPKRAA